ncbi:MAG: PAS domain S-box protein [Deltaproteobacteria bacterium]|nr:PAS domain S-box protein [Deltaproteobacteria bacterium]
MLETLADTSSEPITVRGKDGRFLLVNTAAASLFSRLASEIIGKHIADFFPPEQAAQISEDDARVMASGVIENVETKATLPSGTQIFRSRRTPLYDAQGDVFGVLSLAIPITAEKSERSSRAHLANLTEMVSDAILPLSLDDQVTECNSEAQRLWGYSREELIGKSWWDFVPSEFHAEERLALERTKNGEVVPPYEVIRKRKNGSRIDVLVTNRLIRDSEGQPRGVYKIVRDLTDQRRAESQRETFFEASRDLLSISSTDGFFKQVNSSFRATLGYSSEELLGQPFVDFIHPEDIASTFAEVAKLASGLPSILFENRYRCNDGSYKWLSWNGTPDPETGLLYAVARDVTQQKLAEQELRRLASDLERSNRELETFASIASHDLQEPLRKIRTFVDRLRSKLGSSLEGEALGYFDRLDSAASRMQELIENILTYSRVTTKAKPFSKIDLNEVLRDVLRDLDLQIERAKGTVSVSPLPTVLADATQMQQLFQNLIVNALKFARPEIPATIRVSWRDDELWIEDDGVGFEQQYAERIFGIFQRLHGRLEYPGTGIGLAICRKVVERHGWTIAASGTPGVGATFRIKFQPWQEK